MLDREYCIYFTGTTNDPEDILIGNLPGGSKYNAEYLGSTQDFKLAKEMMKTFGSQLNGTFLLTEKFEERGIIREEVNGIYDLEGRLVN